MQRAVLVAAGLAVANAQNTLPPDYSDATWGTKGCAGTDGTYTDSGCCCTTLMKSNGAAACDTLEKVLCWAKSKDDASAGVTAAAANKTDGAQLWIITCGALVFFMQCGFAMLEVGSVRQRNTHNILFKNILDACVGAIGFFCFGYAFAYGDGTEASDAAGFIGHKNFFLMHENNDESGQHSFFFQFAFAATGATIISGCVAERTSLMAYAVYSFFVVCWIYPVVVHWVWSGQGWLSAFAPSADRFGKNGMFDFAGSGVVHAVGGWAGLIGAIAVGPRLGRFEDCLDTDGVSKLRVPRDQDGKPILKGQNTTLACLGTLILWFGWYGFNCGSTLAFDGKNAGKVATTTTLGAAFGGVTAIAVSCGHAKVATGEGKWLIEHGMNGILGGLVSITAPCVVVDEWCACLIGIIGGCVYYGAAQLLICLQIDDPLNAWPVHGACGVWGCISVGIFAQRRNIERAYGGTSDGYDPDAVHKGEQLGVQLLGIFTIVVWTVGNSLIVFYTMKVLGILRVDQDAELEGLDMHEHGQAFSSSFQAAPGGVQVQPEEDPAGGQAGATEPAAGS